MKGRQEDWLISVQKSLAVIESISSFVSDNIQGKDSMGYQGESLPKGQWNLNTLKINYRNFSPIFLSPPPGFLYQNSKASG